MNLIISVMLLIIKLRYKEIIKTILEFVTKIVLKLAFNFNWFVFKFKIVFVVLLVNINNKFISHSVKYLIKNTHICRSWCS